MKKADRGRVRRLGGVETQGSGDLCSQIAYRAATATFKFRDGRFGAPLPLSGGTSGPVRIDGADGYLVKNSDGVGSKVLIAQQMNKHDTIAHDLIAMVADDAAAIGAEPFAATNTLDVAIADPLLVAALFDGLVDACRIARIAMVGGEIAQLPQQVQGASDLPYIWNADVVGIAAKDRLLDGTKVAPGDAIIAVNSRGIRSNGLTLAMEILQTRFGDNWQEQRFGNGNWGERLLTPSLILTPFLVDLWSGYRSAALTCVHGIVHVTGGGVAGNLARILSKNRLGAEVFAPCPPQPEFLRLQEWGGISDEEAYRVWNMGQSHLIITDDPEPVIAFARQEGISLQVAGRIIDEPVVAITGKGAQSVRLEYKQEDRLLHKPLLLTGCGASPEVCQPGREVKQKLSPSRGV